MIIMITINHSNDHHNYNDDDQDEIVVHFGGIICMVSVSDAVAQPELAR